MIRVANERARDVMLRDKFCGQEVLDTRSLILHLFVPLRLTTQEATRIQGLHIPWQETAPERASSSSRKAESPSQYADFRIGVFCWSSNEFLGFKVTVKYYDD